MGRSFLNIRFGSVHIQISNYKWFEISRNHYHAKGSEGRASKDWKWFQVYDLWPFIGYTG